MKIAAAFVVAAAICFVPSGAQAKTCGSAYTGPQPCSTRHVPPAQGEWHATVKNVWGAKLNQVHVR